MWANPLTYGVAAVRRMIFAADAQGPFAPSLTVGWLVSLGFATLMLACRLENFRAADDGRLVMNAWAVRGWLLFSVVLACLYGGWNVLSSGAGKAQSWQPVRADLVPVVGSGRRRSASSR